MVKDFFQREKYFNPQFSCSYSSFCSETSKDEKVDFYHLLSNGIESWPDGKYSGDLYKSHEPTEFHKLLINSDQVQAPPVFIKF